MNNKKKLDNERSQSVDGSLWTKNIAAIYNENEMKLTKIAYLFFFRFQNLSIARLAIQWNPYQRIKKKEKKNFFLNSFSADQIDVLSELI